MRNAECGVQNSLRPYRFAPAGFRRADALAFAQLLLGFARFHDVLTHRYALDNLDRFATAQTERDRTPPGLAVLVYEDAGSAFAPPRRDSAAPVRNERQRARAGR